MSNVPDPEDEEAPSRFRRTWQLLFQDTVVVTMFDNDDAGRQAGRRLARGLDGEAFDDWDNTYGDVNEWHLADPEGLAERIGRYRDRLHSRRGVESWG